MQGASGVQLEVHPGVSENYLQRIKELYHLCRGYEKVEKGVKGFENGSASASRSASRDACRGASRGASVHKHSQQPHGDSGPGL